MERREEIISEQLRPWNRIRDICIGIAIGGAVFIFGTYLKPAQAVTAVVKPCPQGFVCIDPVNDLCFMYMDSVGTGWYPVTDRNRNFVAKQVRMQKAQWMPLAKGIECYHKNPDKDLGKLVGELPTEMWHYNKWR